MSLVGALGASVGPSRALRIPGTVRSPQPGFPKMMAAGSGIRNQKRSYCECNLEVRFPKNLGGFLVGIAIRDILARFDCIVHGWSQGPRPVMCAAVEPQGSFMIVRGRPAGRTGRLQTGERFRRERSTVLQVLLVAAEGTVHRHIEGDPISVIAS